MKLTGSLTTSVGMEARVQLTPIKYRREAETKREVKHRKTALFMYRRKGQTDAGPVLVVTFSNTGGTQAIEGYLETYGFEGPFVMRTMVRSRKVTSYLIELRGSVYKEVDGALLRLSAEGRGLPIDLDVKVNEHHDFLIS